jgi:hypothetical protein
MKKLLIFGCAALLLVAFTVPAMADVKIGGIIFTDFYYLDRNEQSANYWGGAGVAGDDSFSNTAIQVPNITRLYARWTNEDNVGMYIEFGLGQDGGNTVNSGSAGASLRHAYGWWDVNPMFQIMAGHSTTPFSPMNPSQLLGTRSGSLNIIGLGYGDFYSGRFAQVRGTFNFNKSVRLEIALVDPNGVNTGGNYGPWPATYQTDTKLPRFDITLPIYVGPVRIYPGFLWQRRVVDIPAGGTGDDSIDSYIGSLGVAAGFGPLFVNAEGNWGKNWGNTRGLIGISQPAKISSARILPGNNDMNDAETYSWWIELGMKFGPVTPTLIYGAMKTKNKLDVDIDDEAKSQMYGISIPIDLAKGFRLRPEIMWYDDGDYKVTGTDSQDLGKYAIYGVQFQITF